MIRPPRRSVTRFFIPLIDVLTLLFCIFLLMPLVSTSGEGTTTDTPAGRDQRLRELEQEIDALRAQAKETPLQLRKELDELRREKVQILQERLKIRALEIDSATGKLFYYDPERAEVRNEADARELINQDRRDLKETKRELYYLILYPRDRTSPFPHREQREQYGRWFADVAHGWDIPGTPPPLGGPP
jgi:hypothetical protein